MKIISNDSYQCEICGKIYKKQRYAAKCENLHMSPYKIRLLIEAMKEIKRRMKKSNDCDPESLESANIVIAALNKMLPKKSHYTTDTGYTCPSCGCKIDKWNSDSAIIHCSECGQAIGEIE